MLIDAPPMKEFEKPSAGAFLGVLADIIYTTTFRPNMGRRTRSRLSGSLMQKIRKGIITP